MLTLGEAIAPQDKRHNFAHVFGCSVPGLMDGVLEYLEMHDQSVQYYQSRVFWCHAVDDGAIPRPRKGCDAGEFDAVAGIFDQALRAPVCIPSAVAERLGFVVFVSLAL